MKSQYAWFWASRIYAPSRRLSSLQILTTIQTVWKYLSDIDIEVAFHRAVGVLAQRRSVVNTVYKKRVMATLEYSGLTSITCDVHVTPGTFLSFVCVQPSTSWWLEGSTWRRLHGLREGRRWRRSSHGKSAAWHSQFR